MEKTSGPEHPDVAQCLNNLAGLYETEGSYAEAELLLKRSLAIRESVLGPDHQAVSESLNNLAGLYETEGRYAEAEPLLKRSLIIRENVLGPDSPEVAHVLVNLAALYSRQSKYPESEQLLKRSLAIWERTLGPDHPEVALILVGFGSLYEIQGRYTEAEPLYRRSLTIRQKALGPDHPDVAQSLNSLAVLYGEMGMYAEVEPLINYSLAIREKAFGPEHPAVAESLNNLAFVYYTEERYVEAEPLFKRSLAIREKVFGPDHPDVGQSLENLAGVYLAEDKYAEAKPLLKRSLAISEKVFGPDHPSVARALINLAVLYGAEGSPEQAGPLFSRALENDAKQFDYLFPYMTEEERLSFLDTAYRDFRSYYGFSVRYGKQDPELVGQMYDVLLWQKGLVSRSVAATRAAIATTEDQEALNLLQKLAAKRSQLAALLTAKAINPLELRKNVDQLTLEASEIDKDLVKRSRLYADELKLGHVTWQEVQAGLKPGEAAVELLTSPFSDGQKWTNEPHYVALIVTPETKIAPMLVQLGRTKDLEDTPLMQYRDLVSENPVSARANGGVYRSFWQPMEASLKGSKRIYISPDGAFNLISFPAIPLGNGRRLIDKYNIEVVSSTKDLLRHAPATGAKSAVLIGDPQFDMTESEQRAAIPRKSQGTAESNSPSIVIGGSRPRSIELREGLELSPLPATKLEISTINSLLRKQGWHADVYTGANATEEAIQQVKGPKILHIATHAFFLPDQTSILRGASLHMPPGFEDPMLRSGLFFAGAGRALRGEKPAKDLDDGILTAYEATGLNLQGTELVVLSACETGLGKIENGEGVFGLRRAFQEAGAQSVLMSLWAVPDRETQELMTLFYTKWLAGEGKQQALHDAQQELRAKVKVRYGDDKPFYWGGFVLVGS